MKSHHHTHNECEKHVTMWTGKSAQDNPVSLDYCSRFTAIILVDIQAGTGITLPADGLEDVIKILQIVEEIRK